MTYGGALASAEFGRNLRSSEFINEVRQRRGSAPGTPSGFFEVDTSKALEPADIEKSSASLETSTCDNGGSDKTTTTDGETKTSDGEGEDQLEELNPWSKDLIGIPINYISVGVVYAGSVSILYPILVIQHAVDTAFFAAASSLVTVFWSYKIFFGLLCDCLPIFGQKWKPYITLGVSIFERKGRC